MEHPTVFPSLVYDDANAVLGFLTAAFGAEPHAAYGGDGTIQHAELRFGNGIVMFGSSRPDAPATRGGGGGIYVVVIDPDAHCAACSRRRGGDLARALRHRLRLA